MSHEMSFSFLTGFPKYLIPATFLKAICKKKWIDSSMWLKVNLFRYMPGQALKVPGGSGCPNF